MALAELLLIVLFFVGGRTATAVTPEEAAAIAQENADFDAEILYQQLTGGADEVIMDADAGEGNDDRDRVVCRGGAAILALLKVGTSRAVAGNTQR